MTDEPTNAVRARWAGEALAAFNAQASCSTRPDTPNPYELESSICDLITDLLHHARRRGLDAPVIIELARFHFEAEVCQEECGQRLRPRV